MENRDRQNDESSHHLFFVEAPDRWQVAQERADGQWRAHAPPTRQRPSQAHRSGFQAQGQRVADHQAPLQRDEPPPARDSLDDAPEWAR